VFRELYENIPVPVCTFETADCAALEPSIASAKSAGSQIVNQQGIRVNGQIQTSGLDIVDSNGHGVTVDFHDTRTVEVVLSGLRYRYSLPTGTRELLIGQIKLPLKTHWTAGESETICYTLYPRGQAPN